MVGAVGTKSFSLPQVWRGLALVSCVGVIWGTIGPAVQLVNAGSGLTPLMIGSYRATAAVAVLLAATVLTHRARSCVALVVNNGRRVLVTGLATAVFQLLFFVAVIQAGVSVGTVVSLGFAPVLLLVLGSARRRSVPAPGQVVTVFTALAGLGLVGFTGVAGDEAPNAALGVLAAVGSGTAYALSADAGAPLSRGNDALTVTTATMSVAALVLIPGGLGVTYVRGASVTTSDVGSWLLLAYLGVVTMAIAYVLLFSGLRSTTSGSAVVATLLEPVTAVLIAVLFLDERLSPAAAVGALLIVVAIGTLGRHSQKPPPQ